MALNLGFPVYTVWCIKIFVTLLVFATRCWYINKKLGFPLKDYCKEVLLSIFMVSIIGLPIPLVIKMSIDGLWVNFISVIVTSVLVAIIDIYMIGLNSSERRIVKDILQKKVPFLSKKQ